MSGNLGTDRGSALEGFGDVGQNLVPPVAFINGSLCIQANTAGTAEFPGGALLVEGNASLVVADPSLVNLANNTFADLQVMSLDYIGPEVPIDTVLIPSITSGWQSQHPARRPLQHHWKPVWLHCPV